MVENDKQSQERKPMQRGHVNTKKVCQCKYGMSIQQKSVNASKVC